MSHRSDQHISITGAGTGIGRAIALRLAAEGARLSLLARNTERLVSVANEILSAGGAPSSIHCCDISDPVQVAQAFAEAHETNGPLRALVANSGIGGPNMPGEKDRFETLIGVNLVGTYHCLRAAQNHLAKGPGARHLVIVSSVLARIGVPGYTGYCASKTGLLGLTRSLAAELANEEIQVNAICPGWVDTDMAREGIEGMAQAMNISFDDAKTMAMREVPLGRMSHPRDVAGMVAWLISDDARGVTGQSLDINGGAFMA